MTIGYVEKEFLPQESDMQKINTFTRHEFSAESLYVFSSIFNAGNMGPTRFHSHSKNYSSVFFWETMINA